MSICGEVKNKVIDSRVSKDGRMIRRRRECLDCEKHFTTYERIEVVLPVVVRKDGRREPFGHEKIRAGIQIIFPIQQRELSSFLFVRCLLMNLSLYRRRESYNEEIYFHC